MARNAHSSSRIPLLLAIALVPLLLMSQAGSSPAVAQDAAAPEGGDLKRNNENTVLGAIDETWGEVREAGEIAGALGDIPGTYEKGRDVIKNTVRPFLKQHNVWQKFPPNTVRSGVHHGLTVEGTKQLKRQFPPVLSKIGAAINIADVVLKAAKGYKEGGWEEATTEAALAALRILGSKVAGKLGIVLGGIVGGPLGAFIGGLAGALLFDYIWDKWLEDWFREKIKEVIARFKRSDSGPPGDSPPDSGPPDEPSDSTSSKPPADSDQTAGEPGDDETRNGFFDLPVVDLPEFGGGASAGVGFELELSLRTRDEVSGLIDSWYVFGLAQAGFSWKAPDYELRVDGADEGDEKSAKPEPDASDFPPAPEEEVIGED